MAQPFPSALHRACSSETGRIRESIVRALAAGRALPIEPAELRRRALAWAIRHKGRSGRTARQFVDYLTGELGLAANPNEPAGAP